jgi:hypothetical protein
MGKFEAEEQLEASAYDSHHAEAVHARPVYLGSGHSEFPCGVDGRTPAMVAAFPEEVTCPGCLASPRPTPLSFGAQIHALSKRVDSSDGHPANAMLVAPCGAEFPLALVGSPAWRESADIDAVDCPGCKKSRKARAA